ncbi:MAG TPA: hypothetical protein VG672_14150 [Bryobacteraceae bacterium]|jgi:hypothetical protein|nr:hypothetical protein [Bryobacteraceae bacterium]
MRLPLLGLAACVFSGILGAADPQLMSLAMPDAKVLAGINIQQAKASPFGQYLLSRMQPGGFEELTSATGFDPRQHLTEVLFASTGQPGTHAGLAIIRGSFDVTRILQAAQDKGQTPELYQGVQILNNGHNTQSLAFLDGTLAVAGDAVSVKAAIDRRMAPASLDPVLVSKANALSGVQSAWFVSLAPGLMRPPSGTAGPAPANVLQKIQQASGGIQFGSNVQLSAEAVSSTSQDATALADVIRFFASMAQYKSQQAGKAADAAALLQNLDVRTSANVTTLSLAIPEAQAEQLIQGAHMEVGRPHRVRPRR